MGLPTVVACLVGVGLAAILMWARAPVKKQRLMFRTAVRKDKLELYKRHHRSGVTRLQPCAGQSGQRALGAMTHTWQRPYRSTSMVTLLLLLYSRCRS